MLLGLVPTQAPLVFLVHNQQTVVAIADPARNITRDGAFAPK